MKHCVNRLKPLDMNPSYWIDQINTLAKARNMSIRELATALGMSHVYLGNVVRGQRAASAKLKIKLWTLQDPLISRERMLELLLPEDVAAEFAAFESARPSIFMSNE